MFPLLITLFHKSRNRFLIWWIWVLFLGLPLISYTKTSQGYEISKFIFWEIWWLIYLIWLILSGEIKGLWQKQTISIKFGWIFILMMGITAVQGGEISFLGNIFRKQGFVFFIQLWIFFLGLRGKKEQIFSSSIQSLGINAVILVGIGIWERFEGWVRVGSSFGEPNILGGYLAIVFPLLLKNKWWLSGIMTVIGIYLSQSRSAVVALGTGSLVILIGLTRAMKKISILSVFLGTVIIGFCLLIFNWKDLRISQEDNRLGIWKMAVRAGLARPFTGYGVDNIEGILTKYATGREIGMNKLKIDRTHSLVLDLWLWTGIMGLISFVGFLGITLWQYVQENENRDWSLVASIIGFIVFSSFNPVSISMWILFYWVLAMIS